MDAAFNRALGPGDEPNPANRGEHADARKDEDDDEIQAAVTK